MKMNTETGSISLIPPLTAVLIDCIEDTPGFLPEIDPHKNGLNISSKDRKYFGEGRISLNLINSNFDLSI